MTYHPYAQQYLLECQYQTIDLPKYTTILDRSTLSSLKNWSEPRDLFDYPDGCNRYISLSYLDTNTDTIDKWEKLASNLSHINNLFILNNREVTGNPIIKAKDNATLQAYIYRIEALGIHCHLISLENLCSNCTIMTPRELHQKYYFHDSTIQTLSYHEDNHSLELTLSFCAWMQEDYQKNQPDIVAMKLVFKGIASFTKDDSDFKDADILQVNLLDDNTLEFVTQDDDRKCYIFSVQAENVEVTIE